MKSAPIGSRVTKNISGQSSEEAWAAAPGFPDYEVSSDGRIRRLTTRTSTQAGRIIKAVRHYSGYYHHGLGCNGKTTTVLLNRLVCEAFHGPAPSPEHHAAHGDHDRSNNRAANLRWASRLENEADKSQAGRRLIGSVVPGAKLTEDIVREIKAACARGTRKSDLARKYGVSNGLIGHIIKGRAWTHV